MSTRRGFLLAGAAVAGLAACRGPDLGRRLVIAAGERGGLYLAFAELLAERLTEQFPDLSVEVAATSGSLDNLTRLRQGTADLALALADVTELDRRDDPSGAPAAVSRVYENYLQVLVPERSTLDSIADLRGRRISLGARSSGAAMTGDVLLRAAGAELGSTVAVSHAGLADALAHVRDGSVDALAWAGGIPTPAIAEFDANHPLRMLPLGRFAGRMRALSGYPYLPRNVPEVGYGPPAGGRTIGVPNLLLCRPGTSGSLVEAVVDVLVHDAARLVPPYVRGLQYLAPQAMIQTGAVPLHPAAIRAYRRHHG